MTDTSPPAPEPVDVAAVPTGDPVPPTVPDVAQVGAPPVALTVGPPVQPQPEEPVPIPPAPFVEVQSSAPDAAVDTPPVPDVPAVPVAPTPEPPAVAAPSEPTTGVDAPGDVSAPSTQVETSQAALGEVRHLLTGLVNLTELARVCYDPLHFAVRDHDTERTAAAMQTMSDVVAQLSTQVATIQTALGNV